MAVQQIAEGKSVDDRGKAFKKLQFKFHPDKNADQKEYAEKIFQWLQVNKDKFLAEEGLQLEIEVPLVVIISLTNRRQLPK